MSDFFDESPTLVHLRPRYKLKMQEGRSGGRYGAYKYPCGHKHDETTVWVSAPYQSTCPACQAWAVKNKALLRDEDTTT